MKKTVEGDTSLSFREIVFSPIFALWRMANGKEDVDTDLDLDLNSTNKLEAVLAKSQQEIDTKVDNYGGSGKAQRRETLKDNVKLNPKDLAAKPKTVKKVEKEQNQREDDYIK